MFCLLVSMVTENWSSRCPLRLHISHVHTHRHTHACVHTNTCTQRQTDTHCAFTQRNMYAVTFCHTYIYVPSNGIKDKQLHSQTHTHTHTYIYLYTVYIYTHTHSIKSLLRYGGPLRALQRQRQKQKYQSRLEQSILG